ncbi:acetoacetyl-CoA synthetase [Geodermatophilus amargosae]|uniref:Acetoacetyl-CoA synthetase n=1 Tax=Geodermatophilus amargosae TaxID=1296565 RepID=A0A1I7BUD9_9ACTN|nr:acetoacetate--CoA ligase [Geodermatophilus amargosae]SFT90773.1 acetoacetyl-CoA synthetase [Geodermatophilus amargosae]
MSVLAPARQPVPSGRPPQIADFRARAEAVAGRELPTAPALHDWSVRSPDDFWRTLLTWSGLVREGSAEPVRTGDDVEEARFFPQVRLNYTENLLRAVPGAGDDAPAITSVHADGSLERLTRGELRTAVRRTSRALADLGTGPGETVLAIAPNSAGAAVAALAAAALGATISTATPDMGPTTLLGRFGQVGAGTALVDRAGLGQDGAGPDEVLATVVAGLPTVRRVLVLDDGPLPAFDGVPVARLTDLVAAVPADDPGPEWPRLAFDHPLFVMFSSGTTGPPKAMVHGAGGTLLEHVKEHRLHGDLGPGDTLYFHTTTAWMMWNWQLSALAVGAHVVVYDGPISGPETLWELVAAHGVTVFGTSPAYLQLCQDDGYRPRDAVDLSALRAVLSTGAVLHEWQFAWVADAVGDVPLQSISGGTDVIGCFVLGHPELPVRPGRAQSLSLGLDVVALGEDGSPVLGEVGELVCRNPFPSRPVRFLDDPDGQRFHRAYFAAHPGAWTHGDRIEIDTDGSARLHGRSDGVLNVNGIRIGPSEIYTIVRAVPGVADAMAVEIRDPATPGSTRLALLVVLRPGVVMDDALALRIRSTLRREGSPAHVPSLVLAVDEVPLTHNGKRSESAARAVLDGEPVRNASALKNPGSLEGIAAALAATQVPTPGTGDGSSVDGVRGDDVQAVVARVFAEVLGAPVPEDADFFDAGGTSRQSMTLLRRLRGELRRPVSVDDLVAAPTIGGLAAVLAVGGGRDVAVEVLREGVAGVPPLVLVHGPQGDVDLYRSMVDALDTDAPVYGLTAHLGTADAVGEASVAELARRHAERLEELQPTGPVRLAGYSFGGLVALEMARLLTARGREVGFLGLLDLLPPTGQLSRNAQRLYHLAALAARLVPGMAGDTVVDFLRAGPLRRLLPAAAPSSPDEEVLRRSEEAFNRHAWGPYAGPVSYFRARRRIPVIMNQLYALRRIAPDLTVVDVPGAHHDLLAAGHAPELAARVSEALAASVR